MNSSEANLGRFLKNSYKDPNKQAASIDGYARDDSLSGRRVQVYHNPLSGDTKVVHRGSVDKSDWLITNPLIAVGLGQQSTRFKHSAKVQHLAEKKYGAVHSVGHSQGGFHAREISTKNKDSHATTVNAANQLAPSISLGRQHKVHEIRGAADPVSLIGGGILRSGLTTTRVYKPTWNQHGLGILKA